jgi:nucleotide-binding universal stress UspA family protein
MSYRTILVHVDQSVHAPARMRYAAGLAHAHGARLVGAALFGVSRDIFPQGYDVRPGTLDASCFGALADNARRALGRFETIAAEHGARHESRFVCDRADDGLARLARFADLVVVSQDDPAEAPPDMAVRLPEFLVLYGAPALLVVPRADPAPYHDPTILLAWDGGREAAAAMRAAMPLLRRAGTVTIAMLAPSHRGGDDPGADQDELAAFLAAHHVRTQFLARAAQHDGGADLLALARKLGSGMLVMGCYGHSRFRELVFGGASRTVLAEAEIPLLLAH